MNDATDVRSQLRSLSINKDKRPRELRAGAASRWLFRLVVVVVLVGAGWTAWRFGGERLRNFEVSSILPNDDKRQSVPLMTVASRSEGDLPPILTATGRIVSDHRVQVSTKVSGQIVAMTFEQGDSVKRGQVLARIEDVNYRARRDQAVAHLEKSKANLVYQRVNFERVKGLFQEDNAKSIEQSDAKRWHDDAVAQVAADEAALEFAQKALDDCEVLAPIDGVVLERNVEVGDFVAAEGGRGAMANSQFATIADMSKLRVEVDVAELDIARLRKSMPCVITPDAYKDRKYSGEILWIDPGANYSKATVQVKVRIHNPDANLRVEGSAQVAFLNEAPNEEATGKKSIWIPATACRMDPSGTAGAVFKLVNDRLTRTAITIGRRNGGQLEVTSGLADGDRIVPEGLDNITDGQRYP